MATKTSFRPTFGFVRSANIPLRMRLNPSQCPGSWTYSRTLTYGSASLSKVYRQRPFASTTRARIHSRESHDKLTDTDLSRVIEDKVLKKTNALLQSDTVPDAAIVEDILEACEKFAISLQEPEHNSGNHPPLNNSPTSNLLSLEEVQEDPESTSRRRIIIPASTKLAAEETISTAAHDIVTNPKIYITQKALSLYVNIQSLLRRPQSLPHIFTLYASKPTPKPNSNPVQFSDQNSRSPSASIPLLVANTALTAAINSKSLPLCFDIINTSVCASPYRRAKFLRKALVPIAAAGLAPFAVYRLSSELAVYQSTMDPGMATQVLAAGLVAYLGFTATLGVVAITTANDQMDRITWATGTPLRERWMREEERMLIDRVAGAWGFQQRSKRGEEEGLDWEALREWVGIRGMVLDRTSLMDGME